MEKKLILMVLLYFMQKNIFIGEELLYNYGVNYNNILK